MSPVLKEICGKISHPVDPANLRPVFNFKMFNSGRYRVE